MARILSGSQDGFFLLEDKKGRTYVKGLNDTRRKMLSLGMERNEFEKYIKDAAIMVARKAMFDAPRVSGSLALSVRGKASASYNKRMAAKGLRGLLGMTDTVRVTNWGGVVTAGSPQRVQYARRVSYGAYFVAGQFAKSNTSQRGYATRRWRETKRTPGNPYMVRAREAMKPQMVELLNNRLRYWMKKRGFETNGL